MQGVVKKWEGASLCDIIMTHLLLVNVGVASQVWTATASHRRYSSKLSIFSARGRWVGKM